MEAKKVLRTMIERSNESQFSIDRKMGCVDGYTGSVISRGSVPKADTFAAFARACGYQLIARGHGEEIVIDPPK